MSESLYYLDNTNTTSGSAYDFVVRTGLSEDVTEIGVDRASVFHHLPSLNASCNILALTIYANNVLQGNFQVSLPLDQHFPDEPAMATAINNLMTGAPPPMNRLGCKWDTTRLCFVLVSLHGAVSFHLLAEPTGVYADTYTRLGFIPSQWGPRQPGSDPSTGAMQSSGPGIIAAIPATIELTNNLYIVNEVTIPSYVSSTENTLESRNLLCVLPLPAYGVESEMYLFDRNPIEVRNADFSRFRIRVLDDRMSLIESNKVYLYLEVRLFSGR